MQVHIDTKGYTAKPKEHISIIKPRLQSSSTIKDISPKELISYIEQGYSVSPAVMDGKGCKAENWISQQHFMVDIDNDKDKPILTVEKALELCERYNLPPAFLYYSFSHTEQKPKFRLCFIMSETVTNTILRAAIAETLVKVFPQSDTSCTNADRVFFGTNKDVCICDLSATVSIESIMSIYKPPQARQTKPDDMELERLKRDFPFFAYLQERNGKTVFNNSKSAMFECCEICGHKKDLVYFYDTNTFFCFGASGHVGGSIIDYIMAVEKTDLKGAIDRLYDLSGIPRKQQQAERENALEGGSFNAKSAAEFGDDKTEFVWTPYIPIGDYTVLMADGGTGKTIFCCGIAATISRGEWLPSNEAAETPSPSNTLIISAEDRGELLKKRLIASGADLQRVYILDCMDSEGMNFTDGYDDFMATIKRYKPRLVIIDPWHAFLGADVDINRVNAVRPVFQRLANMAKACECGMVLVSHVNKRAQGENANNAATGSTDFINAARSAMRVIFNDLPSAKDERIVVHTKSNYAEAGKSVKYRITTDGGCQWAGFSDITRKTLEEAARWRKTPYEIINQQNEQDETNFALIEVIREHACKGKTVNVSYDEMKDLHGADIFGSGQPKRAIDGIAYPLKREGITIQTGKTVKYNNRTRNGFSIYQAETISDLVDDLP